MFQVQKIKLTLNRQIASKTDKRHRAPKNPVWTLSTTELSINIYTNLAEQLFRKHILCMRYISSFLNKIKPKQIDCVQNREKAPSTEKTILNTLHYIAFNKYTNSAEQLFNKHISCKSYWAPFENQGQLICKLFSVTKGHNMFHNFYSPAFTQQRLLY